MSQTDMRFLGSVEEVMAAKSRGEPVECRHDFMQDQWAPMFVSRPDILFSEGWQFRIASPSEPQGSQVVSDDDVRVMVEAYNRGYTACEIAGFAGAISTVNGARDIGMRAAASALLARRPCAQGQGDRDVRAWVSEMKLSGDRVEYWVCVGHGRERGECLSVRVSSIKGRTEYEVAEWNHMLGHGPEPDIFAYETDGPATAPPAAPASTHAAQAPVIELPAWPTREELAKFLDSVRHHIDGVKPSAKNANAGFVDMRDVYALKGELSAIHARLTAAGGVDHG